MKRTLVLGGPGTGKTHHLLGVMEQALTIGIPPSRVAFVTFTNVAEDHARAKACERFNLTNKDLPYFRTLHSLAFRELGLHHADVLDDAHLEKVADLTGELFTGDADPDSPAAGRSADPLLTIDHYARTTQVGLRQAWEEHGGDLDWHRLLRFTRTYEEYKRVNELLDFTDMLEDYAASELPAVPVDVAIIDEYQDLTMLQIAVAAKAFSAATELYVAGDDDQSVHRWAGAAEDHLLGLDYPREVLPLSHRLPRAIFNLSQEIVQRIGRRWAKPTRSSDRAGVVQWVAQPEDADLSSGTWLLLGRTRGMLPGLAAVAREQGVVYSMKGRCAVDPDHVAAIRAYEGLRAGRTVGSDDAARVVRAAGLRRSIDEGREYAAGDLGIDVGPIWHDALTAIPLDDREYYLACLRTGEKLTSPPRVRIETIHGAKGAEAENVLLLTDLTRKVQRGFELDPDSEHRVFYVGVTRASEELVLVAPRGQYKYAI